VILASGSGIVYSGWLGVQMIVNPQRVSWLNRYLPGLVPLPIDYVPAKSMGEIRREILARQHIPGDAISLGSNVSIQDYQTPASDLLVPVYQRQPNCQDACDRLVELRLYQSANTPGATKTHQEKRYHLVTELAMTGIEESFAIAPFVQASAAHQGSTRILPLTTIERFQGKVPPAGVWLNLSGRQERSEGTIRYGQIIHYNPKRFYLASKLQWTSSTDKPPVWQEVTGGGFPELVIDQTIGVEPQIRVYQVRPLDFLPSPLQLAPISLNEPALEIEDYQGALMLARNGLWSPSRDWLQRIKQRITQNQGYWSPQAQAQADLIRWHAQRTQAQAAKSWASPGQQVLVNLIDGRWGKALETLEQQPNALEETHGLLRSDNGRLESRMRSALRIQPDHTDVKLWSAMLIAVQKGRAAAIAWLAQQAQSTPSQISRAHRLFDQLGIARSTPSPKKKPRQP
jgi:hypothetical protein